MHSFVDIRVSYAGSSGDVVLELLNDEAPLTVANFLSYVNSGTYDGTFFHRLVSGFVLQGGGYKYNGTQVTAVPQQPPVQNEFSPDRSNLEGTVTMAKLGGDPNSATNQFFFNLGDNSSNLDAQNGGFTVFGRVIQGWSLIEVSFR